MDSVYVCPHCLKLLASIIYYMDEFVVRGWCEHCQKEVLAIEELVPNTESTEGGTNRNE